MSQVKGKLNLYTIYNKIDELEKKLLAESILDRLNQFRPIDYRDFIERDLSLYEKCWKYKGIYYSNPAQLYDIAQSRGYDKGKQAFSNMLNNEDRQLEMWRYEIQLIYMQDLGAIRKKITCEGILLTNDKLTRVKANPYNSSGFLYHEGEKITFNRAITVYTRFINPDKKPTKNELFYLDGFYGNCGVDNLVLKDIVDGEQVEI